MAQHVVIVGGGFGGLYAARALADGPVRITIVDRQNYHLFQPLLYQVATAGLSPGDIASPIRSLVREYPNVEVRLGTVTSVDLARRRVVLTDAELEYDHVVIATGVRHSYFGHDAWEANAPGLKTLDDALEIRRRVLTAFEEAERHDAEREAWLTFVVVGGGPTGVELAGALAELSHFTVAHEFRRFDPSTAKVVLVEAGPRLLTAFAPNLSQSARDELTELGVDVRLNTKVTSVDATGVQLASGPLKAHTVLWAAGVTASPLARSLGAPLDPMGRVKVEADLSVPGHPEAWVVGDLAFVRGRDGQALPGLAPVAIQQGRHVARNILATVERQPRTDFHYFDKGIMATVGRAFGLAQRGSLKLDGYLGWLAWLFIHILYLIGFRNRLVVMIQWAWAWFTFGRSARLITNSAAPPPTPVSPP